MAEPLLSLSISASYPQGGGVLNALTLDIGRGEILGLVGQSGCGKSTLALTLLRLLHLKGGKANGSMRFNGRELMSAHEREMRDLRGREIGLVLQSPIASLNPALRIGTQLAETWKAHRRGTNDQCREALREVMSNVSFPTDD